MRRRLLENTGKEYIEAGALTFTADSACQVKFTGTTPTGGTLNKLMYSLDGGRTARELPDDTYISLSTGDTIMFKGECVPASSSNSGIGKFSSTGGTFSASGNVMSLLYGNDFAGKTSLSGKNYALALLFSSCTGLSSITGISLPATTLESGCYFYMFYNCRGLTTIPSGLLPATTPVANCYNCMFGGCINLTSIPEDLLPATTLAYSCYRTMFYGCTNITRAPELPATTLADYCYRNMFDGCTKLNYIKCLATDISAIYCTDYWLRSVASSGTFVKASSMSSWTTGIHGIPSGWTVQDAS